MALGAEAERKRHQDRAGTQVQGGDLVEVGDAVDAVQGLLQPLHDDRRDALAGDQAAGLVAEHEGDAGQQDADGHRGRAVGPGQVQEAGGDHAQRGQRDADQGRGILQQDRDQARDPWSP